MLVPVMLTKLQKKKKFFMEKKLVVYNARQGAMVSDEGRQHIINYWAYEASRYHANKKTSERAMLAREKS